MSTSGFQRVGQRSVVRVAGGLLLVLSTGACAYGELRHVLRAQVASEAKCPEISVTKSPPFLPGYKEHQYVVKGCNIDRVYTCPDEGMTRYGNANCTFVEGGAAKAPAPPPPAPMDEEPASDLSGPPPEEPAAGGGDAEGL